MTMPPQGDQEKPFFITEQIEAEMVAGGYVFEPPAHFQKKHDRDRIGAPSAETQTEVVMKNQSKD